MCREYSLPCGDVVQVAPDLARILCELCEVPLYRNSISKDQYVLNPHHTPHLVLTRAVVLSSALAVLTRLLSSSTRRL